MTTEAIPNTASLRELQQTPIESVLQVIDQGLVHLPSYRELYYRWERQHWQAREIDFSPDIMQWQQMDEDEQLDFIRIAASFFQGEASVTDALAPYVIAMPYEEMRFYATTQLVDESRHTIFFDRFFREVLQIDEGNIEEMLQFAQQFMNTSMRTILVDMLIDMAERLGKEPQNRALLVEGVTLYHVVIEGTMALAGQRQLLEQCRKRKLFPGFRGGFTAVARDESRHVIFGVKVLRDMIQEDPMQAYVVQRAIETYAPVALDALAPVDAFIPLMLERHEDPWEAQRYGLESLRKKLKVIGLNIEVPALPIPDVPVF
ncbi:MAG: ribonucleotide-diphosphate reductase subunit beta [Ktedonobacteraceae bacterium]|nr:ribonucleotide-diphosphate reductase subunit beta [Ktedonobacteraceae bacterium]